MELGTAPPQLIYLILRVDSCLQYRQVLTLMPPKTLTYISSSMHLLDRYASEGSGPYITTTIVCVTNIASEHHICQIQIFMGAGVALCTNILPHSSQGHLKTNKAGIVCCIPEMLGNSWAIRLFCMILEN